MAKVYNLANEPRGATYAALLRFAQRQRYCVLLVTRLPECVNADYSEITEQLKPSLIQERESKEWPGTVLHGDTSALLRVYALSDASRQVLASGVEGLFGWQHPSRPEDLCLLREDGSPFLVTIAHEGDGYFELDEEEYNELGAEVVGIGGLLVPVLETS
jgi:hypothetical protein